MINKLVLGVLLCVIPSVLSCSAHAKNYRPYISISLAKIITTTDVKPDDETELCDGSGWITHGDGHKTECPGCTACQDKPKPKPKPDITEICKCNTSSTYCNCVNTYGKCHCEPGQATQADAEFAVPLSEAKYLVYHMGADWCGPCKAMIKNVWGSDEVKAKMKKVASKLYTMDADDADDEEFFEFYNIESYPTILIIKPDNLDNPVQRIEGGRTKAQMLKVLDGLK